MDETTELLAIYNIELVSYFLPIPIVIRRRNLLLPLAEPYTSEKHHQSPLHRIHPFSKDGLMAKRDA